MKIDNSINLPQAKPNAPSQARPAPERVASQVASEPVQLSAVASQLQTASQPPVDKARIQEIKQAIAEGRFKVDSGAIADRLIASAKEMIHIQRKA